MRKSNEHNFWLRKSYKPLKEKYDFVIRERIKRNKDKQPVKYNRIDKAIFRHSKIWEDLINADFIEER